VKRQNLITALVGLGLAGGWVWRYQRRPRDIRWIDYAGEIHHPMASNFAVVDEVRLHFQEKGLHNPDPLMLLHGFGSSNFTWKDCLSPLAEDGYRVIAPDLKGFGFSEKPADGRYHVQDQAQLMIGLLDQLEIEQATLCGTSYGAAVALACALMWPGRVNRLILIDAAYNDAPLHQPLSTAHLALARTYGVAEATIPILFGSKVFVRNSVKTMFADPSLVDAERTQAYFRPVQSINCQQAFMTGARQWDLNWLEMELSAITVPTLILWGEEDRIIPLHLGGQLHLAIPQSEFYVLPKCGHVPQEECPLENVELISDFLRRTDIRALPEEFPEDGPVSAPPSVKYGDLDS
jgi:pimeloyl-ACP methyl ester carboxylesterase